MWSLVKNLKMVMEALMVAVSYDEGAVDVL